jgi:FkbM family methyltransferase
LSSEPDIHLPGVMVWHHGRRLGPIWRQRSGWVPECLRKEGFSPATMIDVGAGRGTQPLFDAFPDAYHVLIEPLEECQPTLSEHLMKYRGEQLAVAAGDADATAEIHVDTETTWMNSSMLERPWLKPEENAKFETRPVPMRTLDGLLEERKWTPPFGLKLDTEGYEARVIAGAESLLSMTQFVIAEVLLTGMFGGSYTFAEFISLMDSRGFALIDILDGFKSAMNQGMVYLDALFARAG